MSDIIATPLSDKRFWAKPVLLAFWGLVLGSFVFALSLAAKNASLAHQWVLCVAGTIYGGAGFSYLERIYKLPLGAITLNFAWPPFFLLAGTSLFVAGVLTASLSDTPASIFGFLVALLGVACAVLAAAQGPNL